MQPTELHLPRLGAYLGIVREVEGRESIDPHQAMPRCSGTVALGTCSLTAHRYTRFLSTGENPTIIYTATYASCETAHRTLHTALKKSDTSNLNKPACRFTYLALVSSGRIA